MITIYVFILSGLAVVLLLVAKSFEQKFSRQTLVLNLISKGDTYVRDIYRKSVHTYDLGRENLLFFWEKQVPIHSRNFMNKLVAYLEERQREYLHNMRDSRLLKKSDGISEFFRSISDIEKGNGEIHDPIDSSSQDR